MPIEQTEIAEPTPTSGGAPTPPDDTDAATNAAGPPRRRKYLIALGVVVILLLGVVGSWTAYSSTGLTAFPAPSTASRIQYADGNTFATFATENRTMLRREDLPAPVRDAVLAAEDPDYYSSGSSAIGATTGAIRSLITGSGGDDSIAEKYVRLVDAQDGRTARAKTVIRAQKLERSWSKDEILIAYLNTLYFGRGVWGLREAATAYFGKDVGKLTVAEGAVLAALIGDPTRTDPQKDPGAAEDRWNDIVDAMVRAGTLSADDRRALTYPKVLAQSRSATAWRNGATGVLGDRIENELLKLGFSAAQINTGGLTVRTTIDPAAQRAATRAAEAHVNPRSGDPALETAMVSIVPTTGAVTAYYGGDRGYGNADLASRVAPHPAGAVFAPFALATALTDGYGIDSLWNGTSGQSFKDAPAPVTNPGGDSSCGPRCSLTSATVKSVSTVYWALTQTVGARKVAGTADAAGIRQLDGQTGAQNVDSSLGLGRTSVTVLDLASAYATIANNGLYREPYFVTQVLDGDGTTVLWDRASHTSAAKKAWSAEVGRDLSYVLQQAYAADPSVAIGRPAAIKSGGQRYGDSSDAWLAGYTPQLATTVWTGKAKSTPIPRRQATDGRIDVTGSGVPGAIWRDYMKTAVASQPVVKFAPPVRGGTKKGNAG
ncbi:transglycosylase domain-containing protein [Cryptosporangium aurantiacum]|nr:transglycosylase domain-containing protein [Cryptosporangium aurantiacum]